MRAVLGMPLGGTELRVGASLMLNVLGDPGGSMEETTKVLKQALPVPGKGERERDRDIRRLCCFRLVRRQCFRVLDMILFGVV